MPRCVTIGEVLQTAGYHTAIAGKWHVSPYDFRTDEIALPETWPLQRGFDKFYGTMAGAHLCTVPLVLGNLGDRRSTKGVFESVKLCLSNGCIYSPSAVNLLLDGPDNFVCKLYPITVREIGPGWVKGEERLATTVNAKYDWPGRAGRVRIYRYESDGSLASRNETVSMRADDALDVDVPKDGLVIGELLWGLARHWVPRLAR